MIMDNPMGTSGEPVLSDPLARVELEIESQAGVPGPLAGPGCPGRPSDSPRGGDPVRVHCE
jgi:hypothetical protein